MNDELLEKHVIRVLEMVINHKLIHGKYCDYVDENLRRLLIILMLL